MFAKPLRPSTFWVILLSIALGKLFLPLVQRSTPTVNAYAPLPDPCQSEEDHVQQANNELAVANAELEDAVAVEDAANAALYQCEYETPGMCQTEQSVADAAADDVEYWENVVAAKGQILLEAQYELSECRENNP